ncbi:MAG: A/G-specific adenine glycosylase [Desulfobacter sp.]|nr:A/G-specific adenine glycosylase [Desulfobacter sp.]WDP87913.1 MAG: A/G-specific adenine glycosylase [Desulfobacter sp.]
MDWYRANSRKLPWRDKVSPYRVWVSEVMLQQTQVKTVIPYYEKFMAAFPDVRDLGSADLEQVLKLWEGLGYYARARNLHKAAGIVNKEMKGIIPDRFDAFLSLPGVGDYIASAVLSIAFGQAHAVVDGNVKRVLARLFCMDTPINANIAHKKFKAEAGRLIFKQDPGSFNQAVMELGALVCTPKNPVCTACPLASACSALKKDRVSFYPVRIKKKKIPTHHISVGIVRKNDLVLITRRKLSGLLGGLWEFPGGHVEKGESPDQACVREIREETGIESRADTFLTRVSHAYTHFKIEMDVFYCDYISGRVCLKGPIDHKWARIKDLNQYPFPKANLKFIPLIADKN